MVYLARLCRTPLRRSWRSTRCEGMSEVLPIVYLARHGETAWSLSGQHTGLTDLPLTERGERNARALGERLRGLTFARVFTSPLQRARRTCELAGFGGAAESDGDLMDGTTASTRAGAVPRSTRSAPTGNCSATAAREENRRLKSARGPTGSSAGCGRRKATCCCFPADTFCACWPPAGWGSTPRPADTCCSVRRA
jgi:Histidine phosphatase superfamily (branch 1)